MEIALLFERKFSFWREHSRVKNGTFLCGNGYFGVKFSRNYPKFSVIFDSKLIILLINVHHFASTVCVMKISHFETKTTEGTKGNNLFLLLIRSYFGGDG